MFAYMRARMLNDETFYFNVDNGFDDISLKKNWTVNYIFSIGTSKF